jgi:hypothetical protein
MSSFDSALRDHIAICRDAIADSLEVLARLDGRSGGRGRK